MSQHRKWSYEKRPPRINTVEVTVSLTGSEMEQYERLAREQHIRVRGYMQEVLQCHLVDKKTNDYRPNAFQQMDAEAKVYASSLADVTD